MIFVQEKIDQNVKYDSALDLCDGADQNHIVKVAAQARCLSTRHTFLEKYVDRFDVRATICLNWEKKKDVRKLPIWFLAFFLSDFCLLISFIKQKKSFSILFKL